MKPPFFAILPLTCALSTVALCLAPQKFTFEELDTDGDSRVSKVEMEKAVQRVVDAIQAGQAVDVARVRKMAVTLEANDPWVRGLTKAIDGADSNGDGKLSLEEIGALTLELFMENGDRDSDGFVSKPEFEAVEAKIEKAAEGMGPEEGANGEQD